VFGVARTRRTPYAPGNAARQGQARLRLPRKTEFEMTRDPEDADYYTCTNEKCRAYQKTFRSDEAEQYGCDDCRSDDPEEFPAIHVRNFRGQLKPSGSLEIKLIHAEDQPRPEDAG
jgi:hypothetical protein